MKFSKHIYTEGEHRKSLTPSYASSWFSDYLFMLPLFHLYPHPFLILDPSMPHIPPKKFQDIISPHLNTLLCN